MADYKLLTVFKFYCRELVKKLKAEVAPPSKIIYIPDSHTTSMFRVKRLSLPRVDR